MLAEIGDIVLWRADFGARLHVICSHLQNVSNAGGLPNVR
jgi:hypothetical protein